MNPPEKSELDIFQSVFDFVRAVPPGKVVTYGQVAGMLEDVSLTARQVGAAMRSVPRDVPWQRVVGAGGLLPIAKISLELKSRQRELLEAEGVVFLPGNSERVDMRRSQWMPPLEEQASLFEIE
ncbi:MAG: O(6)-alkylguanine repair protein YbaZ [Chthonomonadaceae bacterium]|nr:O(6)-alkylguanine repair protein YbaZ [Chthonomonadaceae bacterium]